MGRYWEPSKPRYEPKVASKVKKPKKVVLIEHPTLVDMVYKFQDVIGRPAPMHQWIEAFYHIAQNPKSPDCVRLLKFHEENGKLCCPELVSLLTFIMSAQSCPANI